jgi:hypothetical protein
MDGVAASLKAMAATMAKQHKLEVEQTNLAKQNEHTSKLKEKIAAKQIEFNMRKELGDLEAARSCVLELKYLQKQLDEGVPVIRPEPSPLSGSSAPPVEEVDLTHEEVDLTRAPTPDEEETGNDSEDLEDVEEMYSNGSNAAV